MFRTDMQPDKGGSDKEPDKESDSVSMPNPRRTETKSEKGVILLFGMESFESILFSRLN